MRFLRENKDEKFAAFAEEQGMQLLGQDAV
jgi:hypothetical protein